MKDGVPWHVHNGIMSYDNVECTHPATITLRDLLGRCCEHALNACAVVLLPFRQVLEVYRQMKGLCGDYQLLFFICCGGSGNR